MRRAAIWGACALCVVGASTLFAQGYDDSSSSGSSSGRDYDSSRYDRGKDQSSWSSSQNRSDMYSSDRNRDRSDIYSTDRSSGRSDTYSTDRNRDQSWSGQRGTDPSWRSGTSGQSQYGRDYNARYGYRGEADTGEEWTGGRGMQQGMGQQWRERGQEFGQDQGFMEQGMGRRGQGVAVIGRLTREDAQVSGVNPDHKLVQIQTRQGNTLYVDLGPSEEAQNLNLSQNQSIFVHGHLATIGGQRVLMARQVGRVSNLTTIDRSQEGFSTQQRGRDIYGYQNESGTSGQSQFRSQNKSFQPGGSSGMSGQSGSSQFGQPGTSGQSNLNRSDQSGSSSFGSSSSGQSSGSSSDQFQTAPGGSGQSSGSGQSNTGSSSGSTNR